MEKVIKFNVKSLEELGEVYLWQFMQDTLKVMYPDVFNSKVIFGTYHEMANDEVMVRRAERIRIEGVDVVRILSLTHDRKTNHIQLVAYHLDDNFNSEDELNEAMEEWKTKTMGPEDAHWIIVGNAEQKADDLPDIREIMPEMFGLCPCPIRMKIFWNTKADDDASSFEPIIAWVADILQHTYLQEEVGVSPSLRGYRWINYSPAEHHPMARNLSGVMPTSIYTYDSKETEPDFDIVLYADPLPGTPPLSHSQMLNIHLSYPEFTFYLAQTDHIAARNENIAPTMAISEVTLEELELELRKAIYQEGKRYHTIKLNRFPIDVAQYVKATRGVKSINSSNKTVH